MIIPIDQLEANTLTAIIEQFVLGEGTDYGDTPYNLQQKVAQVRLQLEKGTALVIYSDLHETVTIISRHDYDNHSDNQQD